MYKMICILGMLFLLSTLAFAQTNQGNVVFTPKNARPVHFSHDYHTNIKGVKCTGCHIQSFSSNGSSFKMKKNKITKLDFCERCHNGMKGFDARLEKNCTRCHEK